MKNIWIIARMTFREAARRRIVLTGLVLGLIFLTVFNIGFRLVYVNAYTSASGIDAVITNVVNSEGMNMMALAGLYAVTFLSAAMAHCLARIRFPARLPQAPSRPLSPSLCAARMWCSASGWALPFCWDSIRC